MIDFFAGAYTGPAFEWLGTAHLTALAFLILLNIYLIRFRYASDATKGGIRWFLALVLLVNEM
ncbi:MAG TPA: hypothetical protein VHO49_17115, partial [Anaerolineales bacterium]|nr:hypothetical protein [Anaerolineales bacterium]